MSAIAIRIALETGDGVAPVTRRSSGDTLAVPSATHLFTGRLDVLKKMRECFELSSSASVATQQRVFVLHGLGGAGKTQIALRFVQENTERCVARIESKELELIFPSRFSRALFVDASSQGTIEAALVNIGRAVKISDPRWESVLR